MKKYAMILFITIISFNIADGQKVNIKTDAFSGAKKIETSWVILSVWEGIYCRFVTDDKNNTMFELAITFSDETIFDKGEALDIKFINNSNLSLLNREEQVTTKGGAKEASVLLNGLGVKLRYVIKKDELESFDSLITLIRVNYRNVNGQFLKDFEIQQGVAEKVKKAYTLFKNEIDKQEE